ncbi:MAG TPA: DUF3105 domain-containing protein [Solirubrobacteraceae bacterium]|jgi:hypothetical protein
MASRKEEKERLRREREEAERAAMAGDARRRRLAIVLGAVLAVAVAVVIVLAVTSGDDEGSNQTIGDTAVPAKKISDLDEAAEAAGCKVEEFESEGRGHTSEDVKYKTNPPTSGSHDPQAAQDGVYEEPPDLEQSVHALEHGRVNVQYKPGTPQNRINQLEQVVNEEVQGTGGYHTLLFENQSGMSAAVAVTAWTRSVTCPTFNDKVFDVIRDFREKAIVGEWATDIPEPIP